MRYLGIDYGKKRIGTAVSDPGGKIAFPKRTIFNRGTDYVLGQLKSLIEEEKVSRIVVGLPIGLDGRETEETQIVRNFVTEFGKQTALPMYFENEMLTTRLVKQQGVPREHTDEAAAAVILQSYLDKTSKS